MRIIEEEQLDFDDVLIMPRRSSLNSRSEVNIIKNFDYDKQSDGCCERISGIPVCCANMATIATLNMAKIFAKNGFFCALEKHYDAKQINELYIDLVEDAVHSGLPAHEYTQRIFPSIGVKESLANISTLKFYTFGDEHIHGINIDVPNGYVPQLIDRVKAVRDIFPSAFIIAGNVVTPDICQDLINAGANGVKVGIGSGGMCITRLKTGVGRPQFSTIVECADACHQMGAFCISDGGCSKPGDICKAICAGADMVMCGSIFAGAAETNSERKTIDGKTYCSFYGMSSKLAQEKHFGGMAKYRASEGREKWIPYTGPLQNTIDDICGSLRSCGTYIGARKIKNFSRQTAFYKVRHQLNTAYANYENI